MGWLGQWGVAILLGVLGFVIGIAHGMDIERRRR